MSNIPLLPITLLLLLALGVLAAWLHAHDLRARRERREQPVEPLEPPAPPSADWEWPDSAAALARITALYARHTDELHDAARMRHGD